MKLRKIALEVQKTSHSDSPVHRLPPEILVDVLDYAMSTYWDPEDHCWIQFTHVCRYWRCSAILFPHLWRRISTENVHLMQLLFKRSKAANLSLTIMIPPHTPIPNKPSKRPSQDFCAPIASNLYRATEIEFIIPRDATKLLRRFREVEAPALEHLRISYYEEYPCGITTLPTLFGNKFPRLKSIDMDFYIISGPPFVNLTSMCLNNQTEQESPSLNAFLDLLEQSLGLEFLALSNTLRFMEDDCPAGRVVHLKRLRGFYNNNTANLIDMHMAHITFPPTTTICLTYRQSPTLHIPRFLSRTTESYTSAPKCYLRRPGDDQVVISIVSDDMSPLMLSILVDLSGDAIQDSTFTVSLMKSLEPLPTYLVTELTLDGDWYVHGTFRDRRHGRHDIAPWTEFFSQFPALQSLKILDLAGLIELIPILVAVGDETTPVMCPNLESIEVLLDGYRHISQLMTLFRERRYVTGRPFKRLVIINVAEPDGRYDENLVEIVRRDVEVEELVVLKEKRSFEFGFASWEDQIPQYIGKAQSIGEARYVHKAKYYRDEKYRYFRDYVMDGRDAMPSNGFPSQLSI